MENIKQNAFKKNHFVDNILNTNIDAMLFAIELQTITGEKYETKTCAKCGKPNKVIPRVSKRYYGKTEIRLCSRCRIANKKASQKRSQYKRWLRGSTEIKDSSTHSTPKRRAYEALDVIFGYMERRGKDTDP